MARQKDDASTMELPGVARPRGRPRTGKALSRAQIQRNYRLRQKAKQQGENHV
ncbi:hypothetical protein [Chitiniphilus eburneus]|uniref:hypothetical protein n=1 Tax=Chitiniphilus eburneus TaxID=2571148 RepID=UPI0035CFD6C3